MHLFVLSAKLFMLFYTWIKSATFSVGISIRYCPRLKISHLISFLCRRYIAMVEMCQIVGDRDQLVTLLLVLAEHMLNVMLTHFQDAYDFYFFPSFVVCASLIN